MLENQHSEHCHNNLCLKFFLKPQRSEKASVLHGCMSEKRGLMV